MKCPNCGKDVPLGSKFCPECGNEFKSAALFKGISNVSNNLKSNISSVAQQFQNNDSQSAGNEDSSDSLGNVTSTIKEKGTAVFNSLSGIGNNLKSGFTSAMQQKQSDKQNDNNAENEDTNASSDDEPRPVRGEGMSSIVVTEIGPNKVQVTKAIRDLTGYGLKDGKDTADAIENGTPYIFYDIDNKEVDDDAKKLKDAGATISIEDNPSEEEKSKMDSYVYISVLASNTKSGNNSSGNPLTPFEEYISNLPGSTIFGVYKEVDFLETILMDGEIVKAACAAAMDGHTWLFAVTNKRVLLINKNLLFGGEQKEIPLNQINSISYKNGLLWGTITIHHGSSDIKLENIPNDSIGIVVGEVNKVMREYSTNVSVSMQQPAPAPTVQQSTTPVSVADEIMKLKQLLDCGALTQEEFDAQKAKLLSQ